MLPTRNQEDTKIEIIQQAENEIREKVLPLIPDFNDLEIYNIKNIQHLGKYVTGSYKKPVICVSYNSCKKASDEYEVDLYVAILTTILHEIGHAIQEARCKKFDEDEAESVAKTYFEEGVLPEWVADISTSKPKNFVFSIKQKHGT